MILPGKIAININFLKIIDVVGMIFYFIDSLLTLTNVITTVICSQPSNHTIIKTARRINHEIRIN